ncbi:MAG TPA: OB-fold domain-containing protein [Acidimicrobiia bacterium]|nr:OB-fold domain-containing protein [Acidimicrobiia bacterium]
MTEHPYPPMDLDSAPWWEALGRHELTLQRCADCGRWRWPARSHCNDCASDRWAWVPASGRGTIESWTATYHAAPGVDVPFCVVLVRLDEQDDIRIPGYVDGPGDGSGLEIGLPVTAGFEDVAAAGGKPLTLLRWTPVRP